MDSVIITAIIAGITSVTTALITLWLTRGERKAQADDDVASALSSISASYQGLLEAQRRRIDVLEESAAFLTRELDEEKLARKAAETRIEQLSERLDKADNLVRSLEIDLELERQKRRAAEANIEETSLSIDALNRENALLQARLRKGPNDQ